MQTNNIDTRKSLWTIAYMFQLLMTVLLGLGLLPLIWCIPMLRETRKAMNEVGTLKEKPHIVLGVLSIILCSTVAGVIMLADGLISPSNSNDVFKPTKG